MQLHSFYFQFCLSIHFHSTTTRYCRLTYFKMLVRNTNLKKNVTGDVEKKSLIFTSWSFQVLHDRKWLQQSVAIDCKITLGNLQKDAKSFCYFCPLPIGLMGDDMTF